VALLTRRHEVAATDRPEPAVAQVHRARVPWVDVARGGAILAMIAYHAAFDLRLFGLVDWPVESHVAWRTFAASIASTFLFLVGVSLVMAHPQRVRWRAFLRRFAVIAGGAGLVTLATAIAMPTPIYFGILHAIATFSVLALAFLRAPVWLTLSCAALVLAAPHVLAGPFFEAPVFYPLGLQPVRPVTFDYEPVFPWFAATLLGVAFARTVPQAPGGARLGPVARLVAATGRNSLAIYLLHQPVLFGALLLATRLA